jgi:hypothetical protein
LFLSASIIPKNNGQTKLFQKLKKTTKQWDKIITELFFGTNSGQAEGSPSAFSLIERTPKGYLQ